MNQRYKGIECDQCGISSANGLRLRFTVMDIYVNRTSKKQSINAADFFADFCSKECLKKFLDRHYFESIIELEEEHV